MAAVCWCPRRGPRWFEWFQAAGGRRARLAQPPPSQELDACCSALPSGNSSGGVALVGEKPHEKAFSRETTDQHQSAASVDSGPASIFMHSAASALLRPVSVPETT